MIGRPLAMAVSGMLMAVTADIAAAAEFYVDPDFEGQSQQHKQQLKANLANKSLALPSTDAVVDKGTALDGFSDDIAGTKRPQGAAWDIGAYEYARSVESTQETGH